MIDRTLLNDSRPLMAVQVVVEYLADKYGREVVVGALSYHVGVLVADDQPGRHVPNLAALMAGGAFRTSELVVNANHRLAKQHDNALTVSSALAGVGLHVSPAWGALVATPRAPFIKQ